MGITFSTEHYDKIINIIEKPYFKRLQKSHPDLNEVLNIDNDHRALVYKHNSKNIYLLYVGGICLVSQCFEIHENSLLRESLVFDSFVALKNYVLSHYPGSELLVEIIKYETQNFVDIIDRLERGDFKEIEINFSDSESNEEDDEVVLCGNDMCCTSVESWNPDWTYDKSTIINFSQDWSCYIDNHTIPEKTIKSVVESPLEQNISPQPSRIVIENEYLVDETSDEESDVFTDTDAEPTINDPVLAPIEPEDETGSEAKDTTATATVSKPPTSSKPPSEDLTFEDELIFPNLNYLSSWRY